MIKLLKQLFCNHDSLIETEIILYHAPMLHEVRGSYYKQPGLKCAKCGKLFR